MMKKRLSKTLWYGSDTDKGGKPVLPPLAKDSNDLEGIHEGELYLHLGDGAAMLFTRSADGQVVQLGSNADELANYLLKSVWDKVFEIRTTENGEEYLFTKLNLATQYGITMYANGGLLDLPSIYDGLPLDNDTIYWEVTKDEEGNVLSKVLKSKGTTDEGSSADFSNVMESGAGNAYTSFTLSDDKKILTFVKGETFAKQSDFSTLNTKVTDFIEGSDTDSIINKWKELEAFLSGMKESDDLATILSSKWTKDDAKITNWDTAFLWGDHSKAGYFKSTDFTKSNIKSTIGISDWALSSVKPSYTTKEVAEDTNLYFTNQRAVSALADTLKGYVTLSGAQTITGEKDFTGGLKVNGQPIVYDARGFWRLDGDLLVTGGITMFANEGKYTPSTITDAVNIDNNTLVRVNGVIMLNPDIEFGGGVADSVAWENIDGVPTWITDSKPVYKYTEIDGTPDLSVYATKGTSLSHYGITDAYTKTEVDDNFVAKTTKDFMKVNGSLTSNVDFNNYYTSGSYNNTTGNGSGNSNAPGTYGLMLVFGDKSGYAAQLHVGASADSVKIRTRYSHGDSMVWKGWNELVVSNYAHTITPSETNKYNLGASSYQWSNLYTKKTTIDGISIYKSSTGVLRIDGDVVLSGALTMFGTDSVNTSTIMDGVAVDGTTIINDGKKLMLNPDIQLGGGGVTDYNDLTNKPDLSVYALKTSLSSYQTKITSSNKLDYDLISGTPTIPTNTNQLTNGAGFITSSGSITGNAATATALKNSRTLWGQSFDGSANVSGNISLVTSKIYWHGDADNYYISCPADTGGAGLKYKAYSSHRFVAGGAERLTILSSGYVGVNKSNPATAFHVNGTSTFDGDVLAKDIKPRSTEVDSIGRYDMLWKGLFLSTDVSVPRTEKGISFCDTNGYAVCKIGANSSGIGIYTVGGLYLRGGCTKGANGTMTESSTGAVIDASGNMLVTGGITMYSDLRKKTILNYVELSLKEVADAPLIEHYYNSDEKKTTHVGSVAQYWAGLNDWFCKEDGEGFLTMEIQNAALASAISVARELTRYESKTDKQIKKLKKRIGELEEEIENLKKM